MATYPLTTIYLLFFLLTRLDLTSFFAPGYFATRGVTLARLQKSTVDVILRLTEDNPGTQFDALVADLTAHHTALFGTQATADAGQ